MLIDLIRHAQNHPEKYQCCNEEGTIKSSHNGPISTLSFNTFFFSCFISVANYFKCLIKWQLFEPRAAPSPWNGAMDSVALSYCWRGSECAWLDCCGAQHGHFWVYSTSAFGGKVFQHYHEKHLTPKYVCAGITDMWGKKTRKLPLQGRPFNSRSVTDRKAQY